jgi:hypothetical protein
MTSLILLGMAYLCFRYPDGPTTPASCFLLASFALAVCWDIAFFVLQ